VEPAIEAEWGAGVPPSIVQAVAPAVEVPAPPQGSTLALIDLTVDDSPTDKGKQEADVETAKATDQAGTSTALGGYQAEALARWPDFAGLALVRAEEELPCWGRSTLEFRDASNPSAEVHLTTRTRCTTGSTSRDYESTRCSVCAWFQTP
jgi:hypothetical protein